MYAAIHHRIHDWNAFEKRGQAMASQAPAALKPLVYAPSEDHDEAFCVWECDSLESLRRYVDGKLGDISTNRFTAIDESIANLPIAGAGA